MDILNSYYSQRLFGLQGSTLDLPGIIRLDTDADLVRLECVGSSGAYVTLDQDDVVAVLKFAVAIMDNAHIDEIANLINVNDEHRRGLA